MEEVERVAEVLVKVAKLRDMVVEKTVYEMKLQFIVNGTSVGIRENVGDTSHLPASDGPLKRCACCKVFDHVQDECQKNIGSGVAKNLKKHSQAPRGVPVGLK
nr:hypothetical protein [Tanacetum cinerariifolium]